MNVDFAKEKSNGERCRKVTVKKSDWKREQQKRQRYSRKALPKMPKCSHKGKTFRCKFIKGVDALHFSNLFYSCKTKIEQDSLILLYTKINAPKRNRGQGGPPKKFSVQYLVRKKNSKLVRICLNSFTNILGISKVRVKGVIKRHFEKKTLPVEARGGDRVLEIHYCRSRIAERQYLAGEFSINKMYKMFVTDFPELGVKPSYFRNIFNNNFNIGFKSPSCDVCSTCQALKEQIKLEMDLQKRSVLITVKRVHKLGAKAFYALAREENERIATFSFDCQKNMLLPKLADQAAYYSRQLNFYNLGIARGTANSKFKKGNVFLYLWTENCRPKGSNEIASAVYHRLQNTELSNELRKVRLICDGCGAQNKNSSMMVMCAYWLSMKAPKQIEQIEIIFPVPGRSFIPPDRIFAQLEKKVNIRGEVAYKSDVGEYKSVLKKGQKLQNMSLEVLPSSVSVKSEKLKDVNQLLNKHFGPNWRINENLQFYRNFLDAAHQTVEDIPEPEICGMAENESDLRV